MRIETGVGMANNQHDTGYKELFTWIRETGPRKHF